MKVQKPPYVQLKARITTNTKLKLFKNWNFLIISGKLFLLYPSPLHTQVQTILRQN